MRARCAAGAGQGLYQKRCTAERRAVFARERTESAREAPLSSDWTRERAGPGAVERPARRCAIPTRSRPGPGHARSVTIRQDSTPVPPTMPRVPCALLAICAVLSLGSLAACGGVPQVRRNLAYGDRAHREYDLAMEEFNSGATLDAE